MKIVFWQNMPSHHQSGAIRALANIWHRYVYAVYDTELLPDRKLLEWQRPNMGTVKCTFLDQQINPNSFVSNFIKEHYDAIHVFGGFRGSMSIDLAWRHLRNKPSARLACIAERPRFDGSIRSKYFAKLWYRLYFLRYACKFKALLAIGDLAVTCFTSLGYPMNNIFPYMYQTDSNIKPTTSYPIDSVDNSPTPKPIKFVYIGGFSERKGVDLIINAFDGLPGLWALDWIGCGGPLESRVRNSADGNRIRFLGAIPSDQVIEKLHTYDICLVPSRRDGWGVVVNEALMAGRGVITSDGVGSSELIIVSGAGRVIEAGNVSALRVALSDILARPEQVTDWTLRANAYRNVIAPEIVGQYLHDVLRHVFVDPSSIRPCAPWLMTNNNLCE